MKDQYYIVRADRACLERLYMATPQKDYAIVTQSIGRIARTADGKQNPVCFDFVDDIGYLFKSYKSGARPTRRTAAIS